MAGFLASMEENLEEMDLKGWGMGTVGQRDKSVGETAMPLFPRAAWNCGWTCSPWTCQPLGHLWTSPPGSLRSKRLGSPLPILPGPDQLGPSDLVGATEHPAAELGWDVSPTLCTSQTPPHPLRFLSLSPALFSTDPLLVDIDPCQGFNTTHQQKRQKSGKDTGLGAEPPA